MTYIASVLDGSNVAKVTLDPFNRNEDATPEELIEASGLLMGWVLAYNPHKNSLKEHLEECYGFGSLFEMTGGVVEADGVYNFPEDPPLYPFIVVDEMEFQFMQYNHGIVAMRNGKQDPWFVTRMD